MTVVTLHDDDRQSAFRDVTDCEDVTEFFEPELAYSVQISEEKTQISGGRLW